MDKRSMSAATAPVVFALLLALAPQAVAAQSPSPSPLAEISPSADTADLAGTAWSVLSIGPTPTALEQSVDFAIDDTLTVATGCATYGGTYLVDGDGLTVEGLRREAGSIVACGPSDQGQADLLRKVLESAASWTIDDHGLLVIEPGTDYAGWRLALEARVAATDTEADASGTDLATVTPSPSAAAG